MPGKSRRVASRQAQLSRRRKRQQSRPNDTLPLVPVPGEVDGNHEGVAALAPSPVAEPLAPSPAPARRRFNPVAARTTPADATPAPVRGPGRGRRERPATNNYIGPEVRRILIMSSTVLAVIIALGIVL